MGLAEMHRASILQRSCPTPCGGGACGDLDGSDRPFFTPLLHASRVDRASGQREVRCLYREQILLHHKSFEAHAR